MSDPAMAYYDGSSRWEFFRLFLDDGRMAIISKTDERSMRAIGAGRCNWVLADWARASNF